MKQFKNARAATGGNEPNHGDPADEEVVRKNLGVQIRRLRRGHDLTGGELAEKSGITAGMVSQIERGLSTPSLGTLMKICRALDVQMGDLFDSPAPTEHLVTLKDRKVYPYPGGDFEEALISSDPTRTMSMFWVVIHPDGGTGDERVISQSRCESVYVLCGEVKFELGEQEFQLEEGSCLTFQGQTPHRCENRGKVDAELLWISSPAAN